MADRRRAGIEERESLCTKGWEIKSGNNPVVSWCTSSRTWKEMKNNRVGDKKLLVARSNKKYRKIYIWLWFMLENEEWDKDTIREVEWGTGETIDISDSRFYHKVTVSS